MEDWRSENSDEYSVDGDLVSSIVNFTSKLGMDITDFNLSSSLSKRMQNETYIKKLQNETQETIQKEQDASPNSEALTGLKECDEQLKKPNASVKEKMAGFLSTLNKWFEEISISIEGKKYLNKIAEFFKGIANGIQENLNRFFGKKKIEEDVPENLHNTDFNMQKT